jgi:hypothetical protein
VFLDHEQSWPTTKERGGRWIGIAHNVGDSLTYWVYDEQSKRAIARSVARPFTANSCVSFDPQLDNKGLSLPAHSRGDHKSSEKEVEERPEAPISYMKEQERKSWKVQTTEQKG